MADRYLSIKFGLAPWGGGDKADRYLSTKFGLDPCGGF